MWTRSLDVTRRQQLGEASAALGGQLGSLPQSPDDGELKDDLGVILPGLRQILRTVAPLIGTAEVRDSPGDAAEASTGLCFMG